MSFFPRLIVALRKPVVMAVKKPTPLTYIGAGRLRQAAELLRQTGSHRVLVMTTPGMMRRGQLDQTLSELKENGMEAVVFDRVSPDPTFGVVEEAVSCAAGCDAILAVGGGSVLDAAKTAAAAIANHKPAEKLVGTLKVKKQPMPLIAVPTTAGTGSETTIAAVISGTATHRKRQILDPKLVPFAAILDPELTVGLPQGNTIHTAMDALTHALEAYVSTYATPETDRYAEMAAKMIYEALPVVREEPKNVEMREQLLVASLPGRYGLYPDLCGLCSCLCPQHRRAVWGGPRPGQCGSAAPYHGVLSARQYAPPGPHGANLRHQQRFR